MQYLPGKRVLALVVGLAAAAVGSAYAQDTTETGRATIDTTAPEAGAIDTSGVDTSAVRDTTDTSGVQNPPGYRGMERDTTIFPDSGSPPADAGAVENNPAGKETSADTAGGADTTAVGDTGPIEEDTATHRLHPSEVPPAGDTAGQTPDSTQ
jgi:hypothetical protein